MPVSPALAENLAQEVVGHYARAEQVLIERIARNLAKGLDAPHWAEEKLSQLQAYSRQTKQLLKDLEEKASTGVETAITQAYERGSLQGMSELLTLGKTAIEPLGAARAIDAMARETLGYVSATHPRILRSTMDVYRSVVAEASQQALLGAVTTEDACQSALDRFAQKGVTGFIDKAGRGWDLSSYTEMAVRQGAGAAALRGHEERLTANGFDLVIITDAPRECPLCRPHEGKVYSISGTSKEYPSLESARAQGLFHVGCRHSQNAYQPGVTPPMGDVADPEGYAATEKLRYLERQVRASKRLEAAAQSPAAKLKAQQRLRAYQSKIRDHVAKTTAKRQPWRESFGVSKKALGKPKPPTAKAVTAAKSSLKDVNEAHFAWEQALAQGKPTEEIKRLKAELDAAKKAYIAKRK